jgi:hypothetical protein
MHDANGVPGFYATPGLMTDIRALDQAMGDLPSDVGELARTIHGISVHVFWAKPQGHEISQAQSGDSRLRLVEEKLRRLFERNDAPITQERTMPDRLAIDCRNIAVLLAAFLIRQGIPARARCGFARYLAPPHIEHYEDHWVTEYWVADEARWALADAQLDPFQRKVMNITFDPCDVPHDLLLPAGEAWLRCRRDDADPSQFGFDRWVGLPIIRWNLIRDVAALNKVEALGWDHWGGMFPLKHEALTTEDLAFYDRVAEWSVDDSALPQLRDVYLKDLRLRVPRIVHTMRSDSEEDEFEYSDLLDGHPERLALL